MARYCFRCPACGHSMEAESRYSTVNDDPWLCLCMHPMRRDYRAEAANVSRANLRREH